MNTKQEIFNKMVLGILEQGKPSYNFKKAQCEYLSPDGCKCIIGQAIDDPELANKMDRAKNNPIFYLMTLNPKNERTKRVNEILGEFDIGFLVAIQKVHDNTILDRGVLGMVDSLTVEVFRQEIIIGVENVLEDFPLEGLTMPDVSKYLN